MDSELGKGRRCSATGGASKGPESLFRLEAIVSQHDTWLGDIHLATPPHRGLVMGVSLAFTAAIVLFVFLGHCTRHTTAVGQLVPARGCSMSSPHMAVWSVPFMPGWARPCAAASRCCRLTTIWPAKARRPPQLSLSPSCVCRSKNSKPILLIRAT